MARRSLEFRWYPTVDETARLPPDALMALRSQTAGRLERTVLTLLAFGTYCVVALESPDSLLLLGTPSISLPFVETDIPFIAFLMAGPILLLGVWTYLNILVTHRRIETAALQRLALPLSPDVLEARHPFLRTVAGATYLLVTPLVMIDFAYKAFAVDGYGVWMLLAALAVIWLHVLAAARMAESPRLRRAATAAATIALLALGARCWVVRDAFVRSYDLYRADLAGAFLPTANLRGAYAARANLEGAILIEADLTGADFGNARMAGADLSRATVTGAYFGWTDLRNADLSNADLSGSRLIQADLRDATLYSANLTNTEITGVNGERAILDFARLDRARIENSNFRSASLRETTLHGARDRNVNLAGASLTPAKGASLTDEQKGQLDTTVEVPPIYDKDGNIIGYDRERLFSPEEIDEFFSRPVGPEPKAPDGPAYAPEP